MQPRELLTSASSAFLNSFKSAVQFIVPSAIEALFAKANAYNSPSEKAEILRARMLLQERRQELLRQLSLNMDQLLRRSIETTYQAFRPTSSALSLSLDNIGLMDSSTFENSLRFNNIVQLFRDSAEQELVDLNIRIAVIFGQDDICERENPFRPYLLARCISLAVDALKLSPELTAILISQIGESINANVKEMYQQTNAVLAKHGISSQLVLKINKTPEVVPPRSTLSTLFDDAQSRHLGVNRPDKRTAPTPGLSFGASNANFPLLITKPAINIEQLMMAVRGRTGYSKAPLDQITFCDNTAPHSLIWLEGAAALGDVLRIAFGAEDDLSWETKSRIRPSVPVNSKNTVGTQDLSVVRELVQRLQAAHEFAAAQGDISKPAAKFSFGGLDFAAIVGQMHKLLTPASGDMLNERGEVRNLIHEQRLVLLQLARTTPEQMKIDILAMLMESILFDNLLPIELRIQIGGIQFLLLQLALIDPGFLTSNQHPARLLLNRIASVTLGVQYIDAHKIEFGLEVERIFKTLAKHDCGIPGLFQRIINRFDIFVLRELRIQDKVIRRTVKSIEEAQIRYSQFEQTSRSLKATLAPLGVPPQFLAFLENEWVRAINLADRKNPELGMHLRRFVPDIVWSIRPKISQEDKLQFSDIMPPMMERLRCGMEILELSQFKQNALYNWLTDAHARALKLSPDASSDISLAQMYANFEEFVRQPAIIISDIATEDKSEEMRKYLTDILHELGLTVMMLTADDPGNIELQDGTIRLIQPLRSTDISELRARLIAGTAIEMNLDGKFWRGCVHWIGTGTNSMVLSFRSHAAPAVISIDSFCKHLSRGSARLIEGASLFDRAISSVLKSADALDT